MSSDTRRADWCAVLFALVLPTLVTLFYFADFFGFAATTQQIALYVGKTVQFAFPLFWILAVQRSGLRFARPGWKGLAGGAAFGAFVFAAILLLYHHWLKPAGYLDAATGEVRGKVSGYGVGSAMGYVALGTFYSLLHSLLEEYYWRWFVFGQLRRLSALWVAVPVSSLGFMAHHVLVLGTFFGWFSFATVFFSLAVAIGGGVWAWLYHRSGSLYGPWLSHLLVDAAIFAVGYQMVGIGGNAE